MAYMDVMEFTCGIHNVTTPGSSWLIRIACFFAQLQILSMYEDAANVVGRGSTSMQKNGKSGIKPILGFVLAPEYRRLQSDCSIPSSHVVDTHLMLKILIAITQAHRTNPSIGSTPDFPFFA